MQRLHFSDAKSRWSLRTAISEKKNCSQHYEQSYNAYRTHDEAQWLFSNDQRMLQLGEEEHSRGGSIIYPTSFYPLPISCAPRHVSAPPLQRRAQQQTEPEQKVGKGRNSIYFNHPDSPSSPASLPRRSFLLVVPPHLPPPTAFHLPNLPSLPSVFSHNATPITVVKHTIVSFSNFVVTEPSVVVSHRADDS